MGDYFQSIVDRDVVVGEAERLGARILAVLVQHQIVEQIPSECVLGRDGGGYRPGPNFEHAIAPPDEGVRSLRTNGLQVIIERTVFDSGQGGFQLVCDRCRTKFPYDSADMPWSAAIGTWFSQEGQGLLTCSHCGYTKAITEWAFDLPWGFGNLGFKFWNWPPLRESFVEEVTLLLGHRTIVVYGKL